MNEIWLDAGSNEDTGYFNVIKDSWDEMAGWHYELVKSFNTQEEAEQFINENSN